MFRTKYLVDGTLDKHKAILVAKGFQQVPGVNFFETFSPVIKSTTIRIILSLAVTHGLDIQQVDINNAFLNGDLRETVIMAQPTGYEDPLRPHFVCKLNKALYGLKQAPRAWFDHLRQTLLQKGFQNYALDSSLFYSNINGSLIFILIYVDDSMIIGDNSTAIHTLIHDLNIAFSLKTLGSVHYFLGFEVIRTPSILHLYQTKYASDLLQKTNMSNAKLSFTPMHLGNKLSLNDSPFFSQPSLSHPDTRSDPNGGSKPSPGRETIYWDSH